MNSDIYIGDKPETFRRPGYQFWNPEKIRFLREASDYLKFTEVIAAHCASYFDADAHVVDIGCGLGYLSLDLLAHVREVTAIDTNADVLEVVRENAVARGIEIHLLHANAYEDLPRDMQFDGMTASFFGQIPLLVQFAKEHVRGHAVWIRKNWDVHRFSVRPTKLKRLRFQNDCAMLEELGIPYQTELYDLDMGQPFRSMEDAVEFFRVHSREEGEVEIEREAVRAQLTETGDAEFPLFLSKIREIGMIIVDARDITDEALDKARKMPIDN